MARCLVLGANGFIGRHLVDVLVRQGHFVRCYDRYKSENISFIEHSPESIEIVKGDFLNRGSLESALENIDYVFHLISTTNPIKSEEDPLIDIETNIRMSVELFGLCVKKGVKKLIFASTGGAIYGNIDSNSPIKEDNPTHPVSPYAIGKLTIENYLRYFKVKRGLESFVARISNPYGPGQNTLSGQGVIGIFLENISKNQPITIFGDGSMIRDYIYIEDVATMLAASIGDNIQHHDVYNIGSGKGYSINEIVQVIRDVTGKDPEIVYKETPQTFVHHVRLDTERYENDFGIVPMVNIQEGIGRTWQEIQKKA